MTKREKYLERIHLLRTLINYGDLHASDLADRANTECDRDVLDALPEISRRAIGQKLRGMERAGLVYAGYLGAGLPSHWGITLKGRQAAEIFDREELDAGASGARRALPGEGTGMSGVEELAEQLAVAVKERDEAILERDEMRRANVTPEDADRPLGQSVEYWQDRALDYATWLDRARVDLRVAVKALDDLLDWAENIEGEGRMRRIEALGQARTALNTLRGAA